MGSETIGNRQIYNVENSNELVVDLGLGPIVQMGGGLNQWPEERVEVSDPISSWAQVDKQNGSSNTRTADSSESVSNTQTTSTQAMNVANQATKTEIVSSSQHMKGRKPKQGDAGDKVAKDKNKARREKKKLPPAFSFKGPVAIKQKLKRSTAQKKRRAKSSLNSAQLAGEGSHRGMSLSNSSSSNCNSHWKNCLYEKQTSNQMANDMWEFGKLLGLKCNGNEGEIVIRLEIMEHRDRKAAGREDGGVGTS